MVEENLKIEKVSMPREKARKLWREYCQVLKTKQKDYLKEIREIKACYYQLSKGRPILNIVDVFKKFGFNELSQPLLAFAPARERFVNFEQEAYHARAGIGRFTNGKRWTGNGERWTGNKLFLYLPDGTFPKIQRNNGLNIRAPVPMIPPRFLPKTLRNCYLLWEVESWEKFTPKRDPILLKHISGNLYAVMAGWNLTKIESMIIRGRI